MKSLKSFTCIIIICLICLSTGCSAQKTVSDSVQSEESSSIESSSDIVTETSEYVRVPLKKGINLTCWEMDEWRPREYLLEEKYYYELSSKGFDHVRIPVKFTLYTTNATIPKDFLMKLDKAIKIAFKYNLYVVLDMHGCGDINNDVDSWKDTLYAHWKQLAQHYKDYDEKLLFEILNEPSDGGNKGVCPLNNVRLNEITNEAIRVIRSVDQKRVLIASVSPKNMAYDMNAVTLPEDDKNIMVAVHSYEPFEFTHQGATWSSNIDSKVQCSWKEEYKKDISEIITRITNYSKTTGRQVWLGEFGVCLDIADRNDVSTYLKYITGECEKNNIGWCYWEFWMSFGAYDRNNECWKDYVLNALI